MIVHYVGEFSVCTVQLKVDTASVRLRHHSAEEQGTRDWCIQSRMSPDSEGSVQYTFSPEILHKVKERKKRRRKGRDYGRKLFQSVKARIHEPCCLNVWPVWVTQMMSHHSGGNTLLHESEIHTFPPFDFQPSISRRAAQQTPKLCSEETYVSQKKSDGNIASDKGSV